MREFANAAEMIANYKAVRARMRGLKPPQPKPPAPVIVKQAPLPPAKVAHALILHAIVRTIEQSYGIDRGVLQCSARTAKLVESRQIAYYLLHEVGKATLKKIGRILERDHTTVLHGIQRTNERMQKDGEFAMRVAAISQKIRERMGEHPILDTQ
jgi:Bacterial dnaA protein helix-turn-helix